MHAGRFIVLFALVVLLAFAFVVPFATSASSSPQYATYRISITESNHSSYLILNETLSPTTGNLANLTLHATASNKSLSYSRLVNITEQFLFPVLPSISNQSLTYESNNFAVSFSLMKEGTATSNFSGVSFTLTKFHFQLSASSDKLILPAEGNLTTFPSGLIYSASTLVNGTLTIQASLLGTNLPLDPPGQAAFNSTDVGIAGSLGVGALVGVIALVKHGKRGQTSIRKANDEKPSHWVD